MFSYMDEEFGDWFIVVDDGIFLVVYKNLKKLKRYHQRKKFYTVQQYCYLILLISDISNIVELHCTASFQKKSLN